MLADVKYHTYSPGVQGICTSVKLDVGYLRYSQLTAVKKGFSLTSVT